MSVLALIPLLGFFAYGTLIVLAQRHPRMLERRAFILYLVAAGLWSFFSFLIRLETSFLQENTLAINRLIILATIWMAITYYHFVRVFVRKPSGVGVYLGSAFLLVMAILAALGHVPQNSRV